MHELARRPVLETRDRASPREDRRIGDRLGRQQAGPQILLERRSQPLAEGSLDEAHLDASIPGKARPSAAVAARQARQVGG